MADNTQLNQNVTSGSVIATEDIGGGVQAQRVKMILGAQNTDSGDVSVSNPLPITAVNDSGVAIKAASDDSVVLLRRLLDVCEPMSTQDSSSRQRICIDAITGSLTLAAVTTITTVTGITNIGGYPAQWQFLDQARNSYSNGIRSQLNWS